MIIICDTRETKPWRFDVYEGWYTKKEKIDAGDYVAYGHETKICIERKASPAELALNLGKVSNRDRFEREVVLAKKMFDKFIILCEFSLADLYGFPKNLDDKVLNKMKKNDTKIRVSGAFIKKVLDEIVEKYNITLVFAGSRQEAQDKAKAIFAELEKEDLF